MRAEVYCLSVGRGQLDPFMREHLFQASQEMLRTGVKRNVFQGNYIGSLVMEDHEASIGFMSGRVFSAEVRGQNDTEFVGTYIVRPGDTESSPGIWMKGIPCPHCGKFH